MTKKVLILGANGFIGSSLAETILDQKDWHVYGLDLSQNNILHCLNHPRFHFKQGDMMAETDWIAQHIQLCDVILPLVAIASPMMYVQNPLRVFELDFEANLAIVRQCVAAKKRLIFPSTSEVYGMCSDDAFDEETSSLVLGPIHKQRWIYSCSKQMLDRIIYAYGVRDELDYTLFRPFNWVGPRLDNFAMASEGKARVVTQFMYDILTKQEIHLVDGGQQRRCFTDIDDGIDGLMRIIDNKNGAATGRIFNLGNPEEDWRILDLAEMLIKLLSDDPQNHQLAQSLRIIHINATDHYGQHYQDVNRRVPSIQQAQDHLGWVPQTGLAGMLQKVIDYHLQG